MRFIVLICTMLALDVYQEVSGITYVMDDIVVKLLFFTMIYAIVMDVMEINKKNNIHVEVKPDNTP